MKRTFFLMVTAFLLVACGGTPTLEAVRSASATPSAPTPPFGSPTATPTPEATATPTPTEATKIEEIPLPADLHIVREFSINSFKKLSELTEAQAESKSFDDFLVKADEQGLLGTFPSKAVPDVPKFNPWGAFYEDVVNAVFSESNEMQIQGTDKDLNKRPCYNAAYFRTNINGEDYILFVQKWKNTDGSVGMIKYIYSYNLLKRLQPRFDMTSYIKALDPQGIIVPGAPGGIVDYKTFWLLDSTYSENYWPKHKDDMLQRYQELINRRPKQINTNDFSPFLWTLRVFSSELE